MTAPKIPLTPKDWQARGAELDDAIREAELRTREAILARMGYGSYEEYRASYLWRKVKKRVFKKYDGNCFRCGGHAAYVYTEEVLRGDDDEQLRPLCVGCHHIVEFDDDGKWRNEADKERALFEKDIRRDYPRPVLDLRRKKPKVINPPNWQRMNSLQWRAWLNEFHFLAFTMLEPDMAQKNLEAYARLKAPYDETKIFGIDPPPGLKHLQKRRHK
jgi:hypothetical protein